MQVYIKYPLYRGTRDPKLLRPSSDGFFGLQLTEVLTASVLPGVIAVIFVLFVGAGAFLLIQRTVPIALNLETHWWMALLGANVLKLNFHPNFAWTVFYNFDSKYNVTQKIFSSSVKVILIQIGNCYIFI